MCFIMSTKHSKVIFLGLVFLFTALVKSEDPNEALTLERTNQDTEPTELPPNSDENVTEQFSEDDQKRPTGASFNTLDSTNATEKSTVENNDESERSIGVPFSLIGYMKRRMAVWYEKFRAEVREEMRKKLLKA